MTSAQESEIFGILPEFFFFFGLKQSMLSYSDELNFGSFIYRSMQYTYMLAPINFG